MKIPRVAKILILSVICFLVACIIYKVLSPGKLTSNELKNLIVNKHVVEHSLGSPERSYVLDYKDDGSYVMDYKKNMMTTGVIKGKYSIDSSMGKGYIVIKSEHVDIPDAKDHSGVLHPSHHSTINDGNTHTWRIGPFEMVSENKNSTVLSYFSERSHSNRTMVVYH